MKEKIRNLIELTVNSLKEIMRLLVDNKYLKIGIAFIIFILGLSALAIPNQLLINRFTHFFLITILLLLIWFIYSNMSLKSEAFKFFCGYIIIIATLTKAWFALGNYYENRLIEYVNTHVEYTEKCIDNKNVEVCKFYKFKLEKYSDVNQSFENYINDKKEDDDSTANLLIRFACSISVILIGIILLTGIKKLVKSAEQENKIEKIKQKNQKSDDGK